MKNTQNAFLADLREQAYEISVYVVCCPFPFFAVRCEKMFDTQNQERSKDKGNKRKCREEDSKTHIWTDPQMYQNQQ